MLTRRQRLMGIAAAAVIVGAAAVAVSGNDTATGEDAFEVLRRAPEERDRAPSTPSAASLRTEEQTGTLRHMGDFRGSRFYLSRDDTRLCLFMYSDRDGAGSGCSRPSARKRYVQGIKGPDAIAVVLVPDGAEAAVYEGRAQETKRLENGLAVAFRAPISIRIEGDGQDETIPLAP